MGVQLSNQTLAFLHACLLGAAMGVFYDVFRILRIAIPTRKGVVFAQDVVFFLLCAVATFLFLLSEIDGVVRVFLFIGELLGAVLYYFTLGQLVMKVSKTIIEVVKAILRFIVRYLLAPIWRLIYTVVAILLRPFQLLGQIMKKSLQRLKFRLKVRRILLYNQLVDKSAGTKTKTPRENQNNGEKEVDTKES